MHTIVNSSNKKETSKRKKDKKEKKEVKIEATNQNVEEDRLDKVGKNLLQDLADYFSTSVVVSFKCYLLSLTKSTLIYLQRVNLFLSSTLLSTINMYPDHYVSFITVANLYNIISKHLINSQEPGTVADTDGKPETQNNTNSLQLEDFLSAPSSFKKGYDQIDVNELVSRSLIEAGIPPETERSNILVEESDEGFEEDRADDLSSPDAEPQPSYFDIISRRSPEENSGGVVRR